MKLVHYRKNCIGCNACVENAPGHWIISKKDGKADLIGGVDKKGVFVKEIDYADLEQNERAERDCPVNIIKVQGK